MWNHDALFSTRRRWFGGKRVATSLLTDGDDVLSDLPVSPGLSSGVTTAEQSGHASPAQHPTLRTRSLSRSRSRLCEEIVPHATVAAAEPDDGRIAEVHTRLRETAMTRLGGIMRHLGLAASDPSSTSVPPVKRRPASSSS